MISKFINNYYQVIGQLFKFGIVGSSAALVNFFGVVLLVEFTPLHPLTANFFAYLCAFSVSFIGHRRWTFSEQQASASSLPKFFIVSGLSFLANEGLFFIFLQYLHVYYPIALALVIIIVPPFTFISSKFWVFRRQSNSTEQSATDLS